MLLSQALIALVWFVNVSLGLDELDNTRNFKIVKKGHVTLSQTAPVKRGNIELVDHNNDVLSRDEHEHVHQDMGSMTSVDEEHPSATPVPHVEHNHHGMPIMETDLLPEERIWWEDFKAQKSYFNGGGSTGWLWAHIVLVWGAFIFSYPLTLVLNNAKRFSLHLGVLFLHSASICVGVFCYWIFMGTLPEQLYPGNVYHKMTFLLFAGNIMSIIFAFVRYIHQIVHKNQKDSYDSINDDASNITLYDLSRHNSPEFYHDFEESRDSESTHTDNDSLDELPSHRLKRSNKPMIIPSSILENMSRNYAVASVVQYLGSVSSIGFSLIQWGLMVYFWVYMPTGVATFLALGKGKAVFNLLAHFIKGGVFILYGILTLSRYCGGFTNLGWAWNHKFVTKNDLIRSRWNRLQSSGLCTMEMVESSLILFYGTTNVFLEHLSNAGNAFSAKDLQHASIAFIYIGCGLCGVLTEAKSNQWRRERALSHLEYYLKEEPESDVDIERVCKASPGFSPNPFPVLTIFWTGYLMSKHAQESMLSSEIHMLWGSMFMFGCFFRLATYMLLIMSPVTKTMNQPGRPFMELLVSFSLICGGLVFMESTDPVVQTLELNGFSTMFVLNVSLGMVTLYMGWQMSLMSLRDWLKA